MFSLVTPLHHLTLTNFAVPPERIVPYLPDGIEPATCSGKAGEERAFVSVVTMLDTVSKIGVVPIPPLGTLQVNYRTYIRYNGKPAVWFFAMLMQTPFTPILRAVGGMPVFTAHMELAYGWDDAERYYPYYRFDSVAPDHDLHLDIEGTNRPPEPGDFFATAEQMTAFFTMPLNGLYREPVTGNVICLPVYHIPMQPKAGVARNVSSSFLHRLGIVPFEEQMHPYNILQQPHATFIAYAPFRPARGLA